MTLPGLADDGILLGARARDWREAVRLAGAGLERSGLARRQYADEMVRMIEEHGPYVVISPGLALAHARPGPSVLGDGLSVVVLDEPVAFGHPYNDPVRVVLGLAVATPERHLQLVADIANVFNDSTATQHLAEAADADAVRAILGAPAA
ncbi:PTS sugar transporter subunit IIA [Homoserinibacter sp. YIM 151385]|uniref:PTS sugar transporter subunit IIA n=1 Tax=Homoserinibacter sp. YIM 151385 TaxID=2985506 RepID=UPI0022F08491|nr:PTS sugar transporter subunit IIA [Homoserinibacter sp. YIM 151385]WBU36813.1 PTS sugar transporter subunit IIA [Homoserinibacter sp. YIM 151385]